MHKAKAYEALSRELQLWSSKPTSGLVARVDGPSRSSSVSIEAEGIQIEVAVAWADRTDRDLIQITARALGPSHWQLQRLAENPSKFEWTDRKA